MMADTKNKGGRPLKFQSADELQEKIDEYFDYCDNRIQQVYSPKQERVIEVINPAPYTMSGLASFLGVDRDTILNYGKKEEFFGTIKAARERVHADVETRLMEKNATGAIFNLKNNFGWEDKTVQKLEGSLFTTDNKLEMEIVDAETETKPETGSSVETA